MIQAFVIFIFYIFPFAIEVFLKLFFSLIKDDM
jgi:hypothetical protein